MKPLLAICLLISSINLFGQGWATEQPLLEHLSTVNSFWQTQEFEHDAKYNETVRFSNDSKRIQKHLSLVEEILRKRDMSDLSASQKAKRSALLDSLNEYWQAATFPVNANHIHRQPYFIDKYGTACAVGYLMIKSGHVQLAEEIAIDNNYVFIEELLKEDEVLDWADDHGFEWKELAWIQPAYKINANWQSLGSGVNGPVNGMERVGYTNPGQEDSIMIVGAFDEAGTLSCNKAAIWFDGKYYPAGNGLKGEVNGLYTNYYGNVAAYGQFTKDGKSYDYAQWKNDQWEYDNLGPGADGKIHTMANLGTTNYYAGSHFDSLQGQTVYYLGSKDWYSGNQMILMELDGPVYALARSNLAEVVAAGKFSSVTEKYSFEEETKQANNIIGFNRYHDSVLIQLGSGLDDTVWALENVGNVLYAGGDLYEGKHNPSFGFSRYQNGTWQQLINPVRHSVDTASGAIKDIQYNSAELILAGEFIAANSTYWGKNLAGFDAFSGSLYPKGLFDSTVNAIHIENDQLYVGGQFTKEGSLHLGHVALLKPQVTSTKRDEITNPKVYPNPADDYLKLEAEAFAEKSGMEIKVFDVQGKRFPIQWDQSGSTIRLDLKPLANGLYFYELRDEGQRLANGRFVVK